MNTLLSMIKRSFFKLIERTTDIKRQSGCQIKLALQSGADAEQLTVGNMATCAFKPFIESSSKGFSRIFTMT